MVLVLSGGGARGSAHIGVLKVLEEYHVPVDLRRRHEHGLDRRGALRLGLVGPTEIETKITTIDWGSVFVDKLQREDKTFRRKEDDARFLIPLKMRFKNWKPYFPPAVIGGQNLELLFQGLAIEATGRPTSTGSRSRTAPSPPTCRTARAVVLRSGSLATAMRASMSLPGIFPRRARRQAPLRRGMAANFPIRIGAGVGRRRRSSVSTSRRPLRKKEQLGNILTRIDQVTSLLTNANKEEDMNAVRPAGRDPRSRSGRHHVLRLREGLKRT